ncbi:MAG: PDR/VanB family oxidoreductase [Pseudolabrys sp.]
MRVAEAWSQGRVIAIRNVTPTIRLFDIVPDAERPTSYPLGGHLNVGVLIGVKSDTRSYSLIGADGAYRIAVKLDRDGRGGSSYMWSLELGARLAISNPRSNFPLDYGHASYVLIAGGIGITPIYGIARALARHGAPVRLAYAARTPDELAFAADLRAVLGKRMRTFISAQNQRLDIVGLLGEVAPGGLAMICGPLRMLDEARRAWKALGRPAADLRFETFGSSGARPPEPFRIRVPDRSGEIVVAENQSMLDALKEAGLEVISDCRRGECGVCAINIVAVDGTIDHRDVFFSESQKRDNAKICACVSRAIGTVTLDPLFRPDRRA